MSPTAQLNDSGGREPSPNQAWGVGPTLRVRWLGSVRYADALALQRALFELSADDHLLLLEHSHVFTLGVRGDPANVLVPPADVGADFVRTDRGGDVTYHGPGQLVGYPVLTVAGKGGGGMADTVAYVRSVEDVLIATLADLGLTDAGRLDGYPGVWIEPGGASPRKIAAIGVKLTRGRSMHGFALNVDPDMRYFGYIVPCGIAGKAVTSLRNEGISAPMREVVEALVARAIERWCGDGQPHERADVAWRVRPADLSAFSRGEAPDASEAGSVVPRTPGGSTVGLHGHGGPGASGMSRRANRLNEAGIPGGLPIGERKPEWMRATMHMGEGYLRLKRIVRELDLATVCEDAGCPNISECWSDGTATFMINGERCTRACGFCLVDTRLPEPLDPAEPDRVAEAVERLGLAYAVVTAVARDDLADGGAEGFVRTVAAIRRRTPRTRIEVLIPDCRGEAGALGAIFDARPDIINHNIETVARLQRAVRPSASYARSLAVLSRAKAAGLVTKSGLVVGLGETFDEVIAAMADLRAVGVDMVTVGQYLRPTRHHLPVVSWWTPDQFDALRRVGEHDIGLAHVEAGPLTRSSHHAREAADVLARSSVPVQLAAHRVDPSARAPRV